MRAAYRLPVPYFIIDVNLDILECSALAEEQFPVRSSLLDILDEGNYKSGRSAMGITKS